MKSFLHTAAIGGVFESFTGQGWKGWQYGRWVEEALVGEIENPFAAVKWQQVLGREGFFAPVEGSLESKRRPAKELRTKKEMVGAAWSPGDPGTS
jgi:hypothetical protein